ncbi:jg17867 [Pararge aegeria aegeria]|uniref:Jg17867 protein n=1 Tax=Pararge aegeria aegeria TaxID=348720 RepID=A0A8S4QLF4_9NEOP|nr:jg17867 [Pararge aegeria aegeria]
MTWDASKSFSPFSLTGSAQIPPKRRTRQTDPTEPTDRIEPSDLIAPNERTVPIGSNAWSEPTEWSAVTVPID